MKKALKITLWLMIATVALMGLGAMALKIFLPPDKAKALIQAQLESRLGRKTEIGPVSIGFVSGLRIEGFKLSEKPDFSAGTFVSSDLLALRVAWPALLAKKVLVQNVLLVRPRIRVVRNADGTTFNFFDLVGTESSPTATPAPPEAGNGFTFLVVKAQLDGGALDFIDKSPKAQSFSAENVRFAVRNIGLTTPLDVSGGGTVHLASRTVDVALDADATLRGDTKIKKASVVSGSSRIDVSGRVARLTESDPDVDLTVRVAHIDPAFLADMGLGTKNRPWPALSGEVQVTGSPARLNVSSLTVNAGTMRFEGDGWITPDDAAHPVALRLISNEIPWAELNAFIAPGTVPVELKLGGALTAQAAYDGAPNKGAASFKINATPLSLTYTDALDKPVGYPLMVQGQGLFAGDRISFPSLLIDVARSAIKGSVAPNKSGAWAFQFKGSGLALDDLARLTPAASSYAPSGRLDLSVSGEQKKSGLAYNATGSLRDTAFHFDETKLSGIGGTFTLTPAVLTVKKLSGLLDGRPFSANTTVKNWNEAAMSSTGELDIAQLEREYFRASQVALSWSLTDLTRDLARVNGKATLRTGPGGLTKNVQSTKTALGRILLTPVTLLQKFAKVAGGAAKVPSFEKIKFEKALGDYRLVKGVLWIDRFDLLGNEAQASLTGTVQLAGEQKLDLKAVIRGDSESSALHLKIKGTVENPDAGLDLAAQGKQAIESLKKEGTEKLMEKLDLRKWLTR